MDEKCRLRLQNVIKTLTPERDRMHVEEHAINTVRIVLVKTCTELDVQSVKDNDSTCIRRRSENCIM